MSQREKAKVFMSGISQAVRDLNGDVILSQSPRTLEEIFAALDQLDIPDDFLSPAERAHAQAVQERPDL